ncbi:hypothetical protein BLNAU_11594 [Blattamonas nauphoetae]|uniref:Uncharacterized protein n=1 Tax=Blattamonas nauphoetae TaxID=2049346 RepID=A0ABQ9XQH6_9EUKA|nr:hypothetical protein BLNAU_11594 [Blattamonas nauphoetae]
MSEALNQRDQERYLKLQTEKEQHFSGAEYTLSGDQLALDFARLTIEVEDLLYDDASNFLSSSKSQFRSSYSTLKRSQSASHRKKQTTISAKARKLFGPSRSFIMAQEFPEHKQPSYLKNPHLSLVDRKIELLRQEIRDKLANRPTQRSQSAPSRRKELERRRKLEEPFEKQFLEDNIWLSAKTTQELCSERPSAIMEQLVLTKEKNEKARISQVFKLNQLREQAKADKLELAISTAHTFTSHPSFSNTRQIPTNTNQNSNTPISTSSTFCSTCIRFCEADSVAATRFVCGTEKVAFPTTSPNHPPIFSLLLRPSDHTQTVFSSDIFKTSVVERTVESTTIS